MASMDHDDESVVRLEVDASSLKPAFDNIAEGFDNHGNAIRSLRRWQGILAFSSFTANAGVVILAFLR